MNFFIRYKKIIYSILFACFTFTLGYSIYFFFFKTPSIPLLSTEPTATTSDPGRFPTATSGPGGIIPVPDKGNLPGEISPETKTVASEVARGGLTKTTELNSAPSLSPTIGSNGNEVQYYNSNDGKFYRVTKNGNISSLSDKKFHEVSNVIWSPLKNKAILEYPDGANIIYDFDTDSQVTLPSHWKDFNYSPNGDQIVMKSIGFNTENRWLAVANDNGSMVRTITPLGNNESSVYSSWSPNNQTIAMYTESTGFEQQEVFFVGMNKENFKSTIIEGRGFEPLWSPKGDRLLYSVYSTATDLKPTLWIVSAQGENIGIGRKKLDINTWANKCAFINDAEIICAVPEKLEAGAGLFTQLAENTPDRLYKINTFTGLKKIIAIPDGDYTMSNLIVSDNGFYLYFTDSGSKALHKIKLK